MFNQDISGIMCKCDEIFAELQWMDLALVESKNLPRSAGIYAIRVRKKGRPINEAISRIEDLLEDVKWHSLHHYVLSRVNRVKRIGKCPIIYVGAAPSGLRKRYEDLCGRRHTAFFSILALLLVGWKLDFGWFETNKAREKEARIKNQYRKIHGSLPALIQR